MHAWHVRVSLHLHQPIVACVPPSSHYSPCRLAWAGAWWSRLGQCSQLEEKCHMFKGMPASTYIPPDHTNIYSHHFCAKILTKRSSSATRALPGELPHVKNTSWMYALILGRAPNCDMWDCRCNGFQGSRWALGAETRALNVRR